jgi:hypothetical protein
MHTETALPRWALWIVGLTLLALATGAAVVGLLINIEYARPSGWLMVAAFGFGEVGEWLIPLVCGAIGWTWQMRLSLVVCAFTSVWCIGNHLADIQASSILGMEHSARQYKGASADADQARAVLARISETGTVIDLERLADAARAEMDRQEKNGGRGKKWAEAETEYKDALSHLSAARTRDEAKIELARASSREKAGPAQAPGAALVLSAVFGGDAGEATRGLSMIRAILGVLLVKVVTYWTLPAVALLKLAARREQANAAVRQDPMGAVRQESVDTVRQETVDEQSGATGANSQPAEIPEEERFREHCEQSGEHPLRPGVRPVLSVVPKDDFAGQVWAYSRAGFSVRQIARKMGCGPTKVHGVLKPKTTDATTTGV